MIDIGYKYYFFGSHDSRDTDVLIDYDEATGKPFDVNIIKILKKQYPEIKDWNINIVRIEDGIITQSIPLKGSPDSVNNSLLHTYNLHSQKYDLPIKRKLPINIPLATVKCVRAILLIFKNSLYNDYYKEVIRPVLKKGSWKEWVDLLLKLEIEDQIFDSLEKNLNLYKSLAFKIGQTIAFFNGMEIYTKTDMGLEYPELIPILQREEVSVKMIFKQKLKQLHSVLASEDITELEGKLIEWRGVKIDFINELVI